jgi:hypothetical protein
MGTPKNKTNRKTEKGASVKVPEKGKGTTKAAPKKVDVNPKKAATKTKEDKGKKKDVKTNSKAKTPAKPLAKALKKPPVKAEAKPAKRTAAAIKIPKAKDVKEANKKLQASINSKLSITQTQSGAGKYGTAKTAYSSDKEVVTTTHKKSQPLASLTN